MTTRQGMKLRTIALATCSIVAFHQSALAIERDVSGGELSTLEIEDSSKVLDVLLKGTGLRRFKLNDKAETQGDFSKRRLAWLKKRGFEPELERLRKDPGMVETVKFIEKVLSFDGRISSDEAQALRKGKPSGGLTELLQITCEVALDYQGVFQKSVLPKVFPLRSEKPNNPLLVLDLFGEMLESGPPTPAQEKAAVDSVEVGLKEGYFEGRDAEFFASEVVEHVKYLRREWDRLEGLVKGSSLPEWMKETFYGQLENERGWMARGSGFAGEVAEAGWDGFASHLKNARAHLEKAWSLEPGQPYAAAIMIGVVVGEGPKAEPLPTWFDKSLLLWFDRAIAARIDLPMAFSRLANAMQPKWYGSRLHQLAYGMLCFESRRFDSDMPYQFWAVADELAQSSPEPLRFYRIPGIADRYVELGKQAVARQNLQHLLPDFKAGLSVRAWMSGRYAVAAEHFSSDYQTLHSTVIPRLAKVETDLITYRGESFLLAKEGASEPYKKVLNLIRDKQQREALDALKPLEAMAPEKSKALMERLRTVAEWELNVAKGDWMPIPYQRDMHGWIFPDEPPDGAQDAICFVSMDPKKRFRGIWTGRAGNRFEFRGNVLLTEISVLGGERMTTSEFGIVFERSPLWTTVNRSAFTVEVHREKDKTYTCSIKFNGQQPMPELPPKPMKVQRENHFLFRQEGRKITFIWNDEAVFEDQSLPSDYELQAEPYFGLGWRGYPRLAGTRTVVSNMEARMLPAAK